MVWPSTGHGEHDTWKPRCGVGVGVVCQVDRVASGSIENALEEMEVEVDVEEHKGSDEKA